MTKRIDARNVSISGRRVLFDTNIWLFLNGYSNEASRKTTIYSEAYKQLLENDNVIIINDYVLGEFCNRSCKIEYENHKSCSEKPDEFPSFKRYRATSEFAPAMESVRDTCLNIIDDCEFVPVDGGHYKITDVLMQFCRGNLDFTDLILADYCSSESAVLMTDDFDFAGRGMEIITANPKILRS